MCNPINFFWLKDVFSARESSKQASNVNAFAYTTEKVIAGLSCSGRRYNELVHGKFSRIALGMACK